MKTDQELEYLLRATLEGRARTVTRGPGWVSPHAAEWSAPRVVGPAVQGQDPEPNRHGHRLRWVAAAAAAAAVVGVVAAVATVRNHSDQPAVNSGTPTPHVSTTPRPAPTTVTRHAPVSVSSCTSTLPSAWTSALRSSPISVGGITATPLSVTPDGAVLAFRDDGLTPGSPREIVEIRPGQKPRIVYNLPFPDTTSVDSAAMIGSKWLAVGIKDQARPPKNTVPGDSPIGLNSVVLVDLDNGHPLLLAQAQNASAGLTINNTVVFQGKVYWTERPSYTATTGSVHSYDPQTGRFATVATGPDGYLSTPAAGLVINQQTDPRVIVPGSLPRPVGTAMNAFTGLRLSTDGVAWAWLVDQHTVGWWRRGQPAPTYVRVPVGQETEDGGGAPLVAGNYVVLNTGGGLLDVPTRAFAPIPSSAFNGLTRPALYLSGDGVLTGSAASDQPGHFVGGYWEDPPSQVLRLDTRALPALHC